MRKEPLMESTDAYFRAEQVDEQIEHLRQENPSDGASEEAHLVQALRRYHSPSLLARDRAALERARQRIAGTERDMGTADDQALPVPIRPPAHARGRRLMRLLSGLAALVLVGILIGSWFAVTHGMGTPTTVLSSEPSDLYVIQNGTAYRLAGTSGKVVWQRHLSTREQPDPRVGSSAYVQVVHQVVYAVLDFDIYALAAGSGEQIWHVVNHTSQSYFWFVVDSGRMYLYSLDSTFSALNAANGSLLWHNTSFTTENGYGFTVQNGNLYTQNSAPDPADQKLYALDGVTGKVRWSAPFPQGSVPNAPLVQDGVVFYASGNLLIAVNERSGQRIWEQPVPGAETLTDAYIADGILYVDSSSIIMEVSTDTRNLFALDSRTGRLLWSAGPGYNRLNVPVTDGLLLAAREHDGVYSLAGLDPHTGKAAWQVPFQCPVDHFGPQLAYPGCSAVWTGVMGGTLSLLESRSQNTSAFTLKSFDPTTGQQLSEHPLAVEQDSLIAVGADNGLLYLRVNVPRFANTISYDDYVFVAYRLSDGATAWRYAMAPFPPPTSANTAPGTSWPVLAP